MTPAAAGQAPLARTSPVPAPMAAVPFALFALFFLGLWMALYYLGPPLVEVIMRVRALLFSLLGLYEPLARRLDPFRRRLEPYRSYAPVLVIALIGAILAFGAGALFLDLVEALQEESKGMARVDQAIHGAAVGFRTAAGTTFFTFFTLVGTPVGLAIIVAIVSFLLYREDRPRLAVYLILTSCIGGVLNTALKELFSRERPDLSAALRSAHGFSFPSGHAMGSTIVCGALVYLAFRMHESWKRRSAAIAIALTTLIAIAVSRIYLGVHWITDIAAGVSAGTLWVVATTLAYEAFRRIRAIRKAAAPS